MQNEMTEQEKKDYNEAMRECHEAEVEQHEKDASVMRDVKKLVSTERYMGIELAIEDSENTSNYRIVKSHVGELCRNDDEIETWVDQRAVGLSGDSWEGSVCVEISSHKYIMWDYEI